MAIDVEWQEECGNRLARYDGAPIDSRLPEHAPEGSACLRFIDPYGDTTFNSLRIVALEAELSELLKRKNDASEQAAALLAFLQARTDRTHCFLRFIGD